jgi:Flp pilus assembly secretin CpaC
MSALSRALVALGLAAAFSQIGTERTVQAAELVYQNADVIKVHLDQAKLLKVPDGTSTLVVGNPLIADVAVQPGGMLVVTGKGYGNTNLVALDRNGAVIMEHQVQVQGPLGQTVVVFRGVERETYSCTPDCEKRITLGDTQNYFAATLGQSGTLATQAQGGTPGK